VIWRIHLKRISSFAETQRLSDPILPDSDSAWEAEQRLSEAPIVLSIKEGGWVSWAHLILPHDGSGTAISGVGCSVTAAYVTLQSPTPENTGSLPRDSKESGE
jgi:hypothetical protein